MWGLMANGTAAAMLLAVGTHTAIADITRRRRDNIGRRNTNRRIYRDHAVVSRLAIPQMTESARAIEEMAAHFKAATKSNELAKEFMDTFMAACVTHNWKAAQVAQNAAVDAFDSVFLNIVAAYKRKETLVK
jgi:hypothetical protein